MKGLLLMLILLGNPDGHHRRAALTYGSLPGCTCELVIAKLIVTVSNFQILGNMVCLIGTLECVCYYFSVGVCVFCFRQVFAFIQVIEGYYVI